MTMVPAKTPESRKHLVTYIADRIGITPDALVGSMPYHVMGAHVGGKLKGAVLYINFRGPSIEISCAGEPGWLTRANIRAIFSYPFEHLKCRRVTAIVASKNKRAIKMNEGVGFIWEGLCRHGFEDDHAVIYGMTRDECRWIDHGQKSTNAA
jgi:hypothetical protein